MSAAAAIGTHNHHMTPAYSLSLVNLHTILLVSVILAGTTLSSFAGDSAIWYRATQGEAMWRNTDTILLTLNSAIFTISLCTAILTQRKIVARQGAWGA